MPIGYDSLVREYYVQVRVESGEGRLVLRYCPNCGGDAPISQRPALFGAVSMDDMTRIHQFADAIHTRADALAKWGPPDEEVQNGYGMSEPTDDHSMGRMVMYDLLRYNNIVPTAIVEVIVRPDDRVNITYSPRPKVTRER